MAENKLTRMLRTVNVINGYDFVTRRGPINEAYPYDTPAPPVIEGLPVPVPRITYRPEQAGRGYLPAAWQVLRAGKATDTEAHWQDHGQKTFTFYNVLARTHAERKAAGLAEAMAWASERYGYKGEWKKNAYGDYLPAAFVDARMAQLKACAAELAAADAEAQAEGHDPGCPVVAGGTDFCTCEAS